MTTLNLKAIRVKPARKRHFKKRRIAWKEVYLPDLVRGVDPPVIKDRVFESCHILGPAIVYPRDCTWNSCHFHVNTIEAILWEREVGDSITGIILVEDCFFNQCSFEHFGFVGNSEMTDAIREAVNYD